MNNLKIILFLFLITGCVSTSHTGDLYFGYGENDRGNGSYYNGYRKEFQFHGPGEYLTNDGIYFDGWFENNKFIGEIGDFNLEGISDGIGRLDYDNGSYYVGNWKNKTFNGEGLFYFENGDWYLGGFRDGNMHGKKEKFFQKDRYSYVGQFVNGKMHGIFMIYPPYEEDSYRDGERATCVDGECYPYKGVLSEFMSLVGYASIAVLEIAAESVIEAKVAAAIYEPCVPETKIKINSNTVPIGGLVTKTTTTKVTTKGC